MKKLTGVMAALFLLGVMCAGAQEPQRRALAEELLNAMNMKDSIESSFAMVKQMIPAQMERMKQAKGDTNMAANVSVQTGKMIDMIAEELSWDKMKAEYITLYAETFTEQELKDSIAFYKSPTGQAFVKKQPELMKRSMAISQKQMMLIMPRIQAMTEEFKKELSAPATQK